MSQYFVLMYTPAIDSLAALMSQGTIALFGSVAEAEEAAGGDVGSLRVFDISKNEVPVPLAAPGTQILVNGSWVKSK